MNERRCESCDFFSPALTFVRQPTWGYCTKPTGGCDGAGEAKPQARFTWSDNICDAFKLRAQSVAPG